ncbi:glycoside hydrolase family 18 protein [Chitinophaga deserti]|uniref:hypothetical protein n=1 Tax=Chitinophaga deserti TaxID=2164099 RepID=UPI000D6C40F2|nr:hypothetical protein [Chitinophaga deserti]
MKTSYCLTLFAAVLLSACGTTTQVTNFWRTPDAPQKTYHTIFIAAMVHNVGAKQSIENNLAAAAQNKGYKAIKSGDIFPPNFTKENVPSKEAILNRVRELGCDAIFTMAVVDKTSETRYVPGSGPYAPYPAWGWYGSFWGYYNYWYPTMYNPGYYTTDKTYFLESNMYDAQTESLLFSVQSESINPGSIEDFSRSYTKSLVQALERQGLLK